MLSRAGAHALEVLRDAVGESPGRRPGGRLPSGSAQVTRFVARVHRLPPRRVLVAGLLVMPLVAVTDHATGSTYSFSIFYLLAVVAVSATGRSSLRRPPSGCWSTR